MGMRDQQGSTNSNKANLHTERPLDTSLDDTLRQHLRGEARKTAAPNTERLLQNIMYRAQFEIEQLPALAPDEPKDELTAEALSAPPPSALMHQETNTRYRLLALAHFHEYRELMDYKLFRTLGACGNILAMNR
jgi:hypothetical protein